MVNVRYRLKDLISVNFFVVGKHNACVDIILVHIVIVRPLF